MNTVEIEVEAAELKAALKAVVVATSKDKSRPHLHQVRLEVNVGDGLPKLEIIATDGHRLHRAIICGCPDASAGVFHLPASEAKGFSGSIRKEGNARLVCDGAKARCTSGGIEASYPVFDDDGGDLSFPPYWNVIPDYAGELKAERGELPAMKRYVVGVDARLMAGAFEAAETMAELWSRPRLATRVYFPTREPEPLVVHYSDGTSTFEAVVMPMRMD